MQEFINYYISPDIYNNYAIKHLDRFHQLSKNQYVLSEYPIADKLERLELTKYFKKSFSSPDDFKCWKPNPSMADQLVKMINLTEGFIIIGDRDDTDGVLYQNILNLL